jgi:hypothetical protein
LHDQIDLYPTKYLQFTVPDYISCSSMPLLWMVAASEISDGLASLDFSNALYLVSLVSLMNSLRCILCPGYVSPHPNTVRRSLKHLCTVHRGRLIEQLRGVEWMSITCDFWSNRLAQSFLVLTGHYLSATFQLNNVILDFVHFEQRHLAENIASTIHSKFEKLGILNAVSSVTCDGASNMKKAFDKFTNIDRIWCLAHRLHLIVTNALGFWLKLPGVELEEGIIDNESGPDVFDNEDVSAEEESIDEVDDDPAANDAVDEDDEVEMVNNSTVFIF